MGRIISGLSEIADRYDCFILDVFGVIHNGIDLFEGTAGCLQELKAAGKAVCLLSNSPRRAHIVGAQILGKGLPDEGLFQHVMTSGEATYQALQGMDIGQRCWFIGADIGQEVLDGHAFEQVRGPEEADFVLNSLIGQSGEDKAGIVEALRVAVDRGLPMICANPDLVVNIGAEQYECAGTFAALYEEMGGVVTYHGKPYAPVYEACYEFLGRPDKSRICAVGDAFHTDVAGANGFGIDVVWNIEGIHEEEVTCDLKGEISDELIEGMLNDKAEKPSYVMKGFGW